jgi:hypothetical protein
VKTDKRSGNPSLETSFGVLGKFCHIYMRHALQPPQASLLGGFPDLPSDDSSVGNSGEVRMFEFLQSFCMGLLACIFRPPSYSWQCLTGELIPASYQCFS